MSKNEKKWSCSMCTFDNYQASIKCSICLHPRGSEVIRFPPVTQEKPLVIHDIESTSTTDSYSNFIICPPSCSSNSDGKSLNVAASNQFNQANSALRQYQDETNSKQSNKSWFCMTCSFTNPGDNSFCSQCNIHKKKAFEASLGDSQNACFSKESKKVSTKWICSVCTYENWNASRKCAICQNEKGATHNNRLIKVDDERQPQKNKVECLNAATSSKTPLDQTTTDSITGLIKQKGLQGFENTLSSHNNENLTKSVDITLSKDTHARKHKSRSPSVSSGSSHSSDDTKTSTSQHRSNRQRRKKVNQPSSSVNSLAENNKGSKPGKLSRSNSTNHLFSSGCLDLIDNRSFKNRTRNLNWLFLKACIGVVDGNAEAVDAYMAHGGNIARCLTFDEINSLNRPSAFDVGHTLVHLAIRFKRHNILGLLLTPEIAPRGFKRNPSHLSPDIADLIRREIMMSLRTIKGDFHCRFLSECSTFQLPVEICDFPSAIQQLLFNEMLDQDVQKELEEESAINWSPSLLRLGDCNNQLYSLWNRSAGDCLLDSVLQATWGVFDRDNVLRSAMSESLQDCGTSFYKRWKDWELQQADILGYSLTERQCLEDWSIIHSLAQQPGASLEHCHIFVLSHILRRPIIVYGIKYLKSFRGDALGFAKFQGVYLPFLWDQSFCYKSPIALGYTRGHFTALVTMENDSKDFRSTSRQRAPFNTIQNLPLVDSDGKILPIHFTLKDECRDEEQRKEILNEWLDCYVTDDGFLMARQRPGKRPPSVTRLVDGWLDHYRHLAFKRLGEVGDSDSDDE